MARAIWNDTVLAESDDTVVVEGNHYFPLESLDQDKLARAITVRSAHGRVKRRTSTSSSTATRTRQPRGTTRPRSRRLPRSLVESRFGAACESRLTRPGRQAERRWVMPSSPIDRQRSRTMR